MKLKMMENDIVGIYIDDTLWGMLAHTDALYKIDPKLVKILGDGGEVVFELEGVDDETN